MGKIVGEDTLGYVTIAGNQGTAFLEPGGNIYRCLQECSMTEDTTEDSDEVRKIAKGEKIVVVEFPKKDFLRLKGRAQLDGAVGWVTVSREKEEGDKKETEKLLEVC